MPPPPSSADVSPFSRFVVKAVAVLMKQDVEAALARGGGGANRLTSKDADKVGKVIELSILVT